MRIMPGERPANQVRASSGARAARVQERVCAVKLTIFCRERPPLRSARGGATSIRSSRNATEGVPYRRLRWNHVNLMRIFAEQKRNCRRQWMASNKLSLEIIRV